MRWVGHVARVGKRQKPTEFLWGNQKDRDNLQDLGVEVRIILREILQKQNKMV